MQNVVSMLWEHANEGTEPTKADMEWVHKIYLKVKKTMSEPVENSTSPERTAPETPDSPPQRSARRPPRSHMAYRSGGSTLPASCR